MRALAAAALLLATLVPAAAQIPDPDRPPGIVRAEVAALMQPITYNRFGSYNPHGMIYALVEDLEDMAGAPVTLATARAGAVRLRSDLRPRPLVLRANAGDILEIRFVNLLPRGREAAGVCPHDRDPDAEGRRRPLASCRAGVSVIGLEPEAGQDSALAQGLAPVAQGEGYTVRFRIQRPGAHLMLSHAAPAGGQGGGGSLTHGLFGVVIAGQPGSRYYRSQVTEPVLRAARNLDAQGQARAGAPWLDYEARGPGGRPLLAMHDCVEACADPQRAVWRVRHGDLNAVVWERPRPGAPFSARRDFTVVFHDELKTRYPPRFAVLGREEERTRGAMLGGIGDGFAINYGASGMGTALIANRLGIGPAANCVECAYEEFFLQSWANGDPALLRDYGDDPSNVHHSYLGDRVSFQNLHAGPKETHVFHLHAHQWRGGEGDGGAYLDSQTIAPFQAFSYEVDHGGSGNLNLTPGDSIFHCHLYPHFAQGMWALWRVHDVLEQGERRLPDGEHGAGTDPRTGQTAPGSGTPIPAVVPLPGLALPPEPDYAAGRPGFPFFIPGEAGHRAPQAPLDLADDAGLGRHVVRGGERTLSGVPAAQRTAADPGALGRGIEHADFSSVLDVAEIALLPPEGTDLERAAMAFHGEGAPLRVALMPTGTALAPQPVAAADIPGLQAQGIRVLGGYERPLPERPGATGIFAVNGRPPRPGAPFADPCMLAPADEPAAGPDYLARLRAWLAGDGASRGYRLYEVSAVDLDMQVNAAGWHDPQGRINVLTAEADRWSDPPTNPDGSPRAQTPRRVAPFFFRARSGECIVFVHENRTRLELERDDFQVRTPTDTIGQHIHLVKFDVLAADGSANGWNYEDGTFARGALIERLHAARAGRLLRADGSAVPPAELDALIRDLEAQPRYQRTFQRWWADPYYRRRDTQPAAWLRWCEAQSPADRPRLCRDATLGTVFTHDHFGPSSIQQHGFYSALMVEPAGSRWYAPDGQRLCDDALNSGPAPCLPAVTQLDPERMVFAPSAQAFIRVAETTADRADAEGHFSGREFPMAIADFALLYDPNGAREALNCTAAQGEEETHRDRCLPALAPEAQLQIAGWRARFGTPVNRPARPEAISADHHDPYLVNYAHEPLALRLGQACDRREPDAAGPCVAWRAHWNINGPAPDVALGGPRPVTLRRSDPAAMFASPVHGDPFTEIFRAFEGERVQFRLIQGAQEVQHMFSLHGLAWPRDGQSPRAPGSLVSAQEMGISEHFEVNIALPGDSLRPTGGDPFCSDYFYSFGTTDALWNGAWGLVRAYDRAVRADNACGPRPETAAARRDRIARERALCTPGSVETPCGSDPPRILAATDAASGSTEDRRRIGIRGTAPLVRGPGAAAQDPLPICPANAPRRRYQLDVREDANRRYNAPGGIRDPYGIRVTATTMLTSAGRGHSGTTRALPDLPGHPLVLRARAGECLEIAIRNRLPAAVALPVGEAPMPRIASFNTAEQDPAANVARLRRPAARVLRPSRAIGIAPASVWTSPQNGAAGAFGMNDANAVLVGPGTAPPTHLEYYMGYVEDGPVAPDGSIPKVYRPFVFGPVPLLAFGDPIHHPVHGITGALVVLPEAAEPEHWTARQTRVRDGAGTWQEMVLVVRDGLNLHAPDRRGRIRPLPDCAICDDSYDWGERAVNFGSEPYWQRLGRRLPTSAEANWPEHRDEIFPLRFFLGTDPATPTMRVTEGEEIRLHVLMPQGRARQHAFTVLGHDYAAPDAFPGENGAPRMGFLSPGAALVAPGRAFTATLGPARRGLWMYRDGPQMFSASGVWGHIRVDGR